jgi:hypothetical protein
MQLWCTLSTVHIYKEVSDLDNLFTIKVFAGRKDVKAWIIQNLSHRYYQGGQAIRATGILFHTPSLEVIHDKIPKSSMTTQTINNTFRNFDYLRIK